MSLDSRLVILIHKFILDREPGVDGMNEGALESALGRIQNKRMYDDLDDVFEIAGMYAEAQTSAPHLCPRFPIWQSKDF